MIAQPILWIAFAALFCSLTLLLAGFRPLTLPGRRCRQCGYRLDGVEDAPRCPECGSSTRFATDGDSKGSSRSRASLRRLGFSGVILSVAMLAFTWLADPKRLAATPTWFLEHVDSRAMPLYGTAAEIGVIAELHQRMRDGRIHRGATIEITERILGSLSADDRRWTVAGPLLLSAWDDGAIDARTVSATDPMWPSLDLDTNVFATTELLPIHVDASCRWMAPVDAGRTGLELVLRLREIRIDGETLRRSGFSIHGGWPMHAGTMGTGVQLPSVDLLPGEYDVEVDMVAELLDVRSSTATTESIGIRTYTVRDRLTIHPSAKPLTDAEACDRWREELERYSWIEGRPELRNGFRLHLATLSKSIAPPGRMRIDPIDQQNWTVGSIEQHSWPHEHALRCPRPEVRGRMIDVVAIVDVFQHGETDSEDQSLRFHVSTPIPNDLGGEHPDAAIDDRVFLDCTIDIEVPMLRPRP